MASDWTGREPGSPAVDAGQSAGAAPDSGVLAPGDFLEDYEVVAPLGAGGMAQLYLARRRGAGGFSRLVTLKLVQPELAQDEEMIRRLLKEARVAANIMHPNVVHVEAVGRHRGTYFVAMEYVHGVTVAKLLERIAHRHLRPRLKLSVWLAAQIAEALHAVHESVDEDGSALRLVHGDVSPQNVLIGCTGHVKLIDFGATASQTGTHEHPRRRLLGRLRYLSPEQLQLQRVDRRTDIYALGMLLWEMLTARPLLRCRSLDDERDWALREFPPPPSRYSRQSTDALDDVVLRALGYDPSTRYWSALELRAALLNAVPDAARVDAPTVSRFVCSLFGEDLDRRRAAWPRQLTGLIALPTVPREPGSVEELTASHLELPTSAEVHEPAAIAPSSHPADAAVPEDEDAPTRVMLREPRASGYVQPTSARSRTSTIPGARATPAPLRVFGIPLITIWLALWAMLLGALLAWSIPRLVP